MLAASGTSSARRPRIARRAPHRAPRRAVPLPRIAPRGRMNRARTSHIIPSHMYLVVIAILSLLLSLAGPYYPWIADRGSVLAAVGIVTALPVLVAAALTPAVLRRIEKQVEDPARGQTLLARGQTTVQTLIGLGHSALLLFTEWLTICRTLPYVGDLPLLPSLIAMTPFLLSIMLAWLVLYPADRAIRQIALEVYLFRGKPVRPVWGAWEYLQYNLRHQVLFVLAPMLLILMARDVIDRYQQQIVRWTGQPYGPDLLVGGAAVVVAIIAPALLRRIWVTHPLPAGPLRMRLELVARRLRLRCREILVWRAGGMLVNAAVMGVVPPLRYVLITDGMLEQMDDEKIEAVFGHEAGHVKRHHILFFMLFALITGSLVTIVTIRARPLAEAWHNVAMGGLGVLLLVKWGVLFGWISRRFERQADMFGAYTLAVGGVACAQPCPVHGALLNAPGDPPRDVLCTTAAQVFGNTLNEVAVLNGIPPEAPSWRHSSISSRSRFLQAAALDPRTAQRFERNVLWIKLGIFAAATLTTIWAAYELELWRAVRAAWPALAAP